MFAHLDQCNQTTVLTFIIQLQTAQALHFYINIACVYPSKPKVNVGYTQSGHKEKTSSRSKTLQANATWLCYWNMQGVGITGGKMVRLKIDLLHALVCKVDP